MGKRRLVLKRRPQNALSELLKKEYERGRMDGAVPASDHYEYYEVIDLLLERIQLQKDMFILARKIDASLGSPSELYYMKARYKNITRRCDALLKDIDFYGYSQ